MKVYGMTSMRDGRQVRVIGAFPTIAAFLEAAGERMSGWKWGGSTTANTIECETALADPGTVFYRGLDLHGNDPWTAQARSDLETA